MDRTKLKAYAPQARHDFIQAVTARAASHGLAATTVEPIIAQGEVILIGGKPFPRAMARKRKALEERITRQGFEQTMDAMAYTWFNRFAAIRFMELHGYLEHGYRVLSRPAPDKTTPEILEHAEHVDLPGLNQTEVINLKLDGTREAELYRMLLMAQCNALHAAMPFLFERIDDETELLLPDNLLHSDSLIRKLVNGVDEEDWQEVEIIGWLYQFYISEKKDQVIGKVVKSEDIPAATQLFTPNWIVKYLVQNSLGRQWMTTYPNSPLKQQMEYYIEPAEQTPEVHAQLKAITPESLNPEELTLLDPACGSGHILVEAYDLFKAIYQERGYRARDIPSLILQKNLYGLEIDDRAAQLAAFALMMKARAEDRCIFASGIQPHILAIQESKGLNEKEITEALNRPLLVGETQRQKGGIAQADVAQLIALFEHSKTFGSLIRVPAELAEKLPAIAERVQDVFAYGEMLEQAVARSLRPLIEQVQILADRYDAVVTNPPYMGSNLFNYALKAFINVNYPDAKNDLYACFIMRNLNLSRDFGYVGMITIPNWMSLSSFEKLRVYVLNSSTITTFLHNGRGVWGSDFGSCSFTLWKKHISTYQGIYKRLFDKQGSVADTEELIERFFAGSAFVVSDDKFFLIPGCPLTSYWVSSNVRKVFRDSFPLIEAARPRQGMATTNNSLFLRFWSEVSIDKTSFNETSEDSAEASDKKWFPYNKGGAFCKWYGNHDFVVNFEQRGQAICDYIDNTPGVNVKSNGRVINRELFFHESLSWSKVSIGSLALRYYPNGFVFDVAGGSIFSDDKSILLYLLGFINSIVVYRLLEAISPTVNFEIGQIARLPVLKNWQEFFGKVNPVVEKLILLSRDSWNCSETSWNFQRNGFIHEMRYSSVEVSFNQWRDRCESYFRVTKDLEEQNNRIFIEQYGLQDELSPEISEDQITLYRPNREEDTKRLISYAIGCMMGRYSLDMPGLIYAHSSNHRFWDIYHEKHKRYEKDKTGIFSYDSCLSWSMFPPDADGIIPMMETNWFPDDASNRLVEFISVAWPKEHLEENLTFLADSLGPNRNEQPRETIRRYLATGFYKHHLSMYKRRPIYWLFSSGKQRAFQCLVYLHRYHEGTLSRMRTEYVIPLQGKMAARLDQLADDIAAASSTSHRKRLEKERDTLRKQHMELQAFDEQLRHYADRRISLDLDDGVKVNYGKFGDLLAEVKAVTGGTMDETP